MNFPRAAEAPLWAGLCMRGAWLVRKKERQKDAAGPDPHLLRVPCPSEGCCMHSLLSPPFYFFLSPPQPQSETQRESGAPQTSRLPGRPDFASCLSCLVASRKGCLLLHRSQLGFLCPETLAFLIKSNLHSNCI